MGQVRVAAQPHDAQIEPHFRAPRGSVREIRRPGIDGANTESAGTKLSHSAGTKQEKFRCFAADTDTPNNAGGGKRERLAGHQAHIHSLGSDRETCSKEAKETRNAALSSAARPPH